MTILTHAVIGSLVGLKSDNLLIAALGGFASHFVADFIPHNDYLYFLYRRSSNSYTSFISKVILFITGLYILSLFIFVPKDGVLPSIIGAVFAVVPDVLTGLRSTLKRRPDLFDKFHGLTHHRLTIAEWLFNRSNPGNKICNTDHATENFGRMAASKAARLGWIVETILEFGVLLFCLVQIGLSRV